MSVPNGITPEQAQQMIQGFQDAAAIKAIMFPKAAIDLLLSQPNAVNLRCYYAKGLTDGLPTLVLVAADAQGKDIKTLYIDDGARCPPLCG